MTQSSNVKRAAAISAFALAALALVAGPVGAATSDVQVAKRALITASDVPEGLTRMVFKAQKGSFDDNADLGDAAPPACKRFTKAGKALDKRTRASAKVTYKQSNDEVSENIAVARSAKDLDKKVDILLAPSTAQCLDEVYQSESERQFQSEPQTAGAQVDVQVERAVVNSPGIATEGYEITLTVVLAGQTTRSQQSLLLLTRGRVSAQLLLQSDRPTLFAQRDAILKAAADKLKTAASRLS